MKFGSYLSKCKFNMAFFLLKKCTKSDLYDERKRQWYYALFIEPSFKVAFIKLLWGAISKEIKDGQEIPKIQMAATGLPSV